jgi:hypothetical protein
MIKYIFHAINVLVYKCVVYKFPFQRSGSKSQPTSYLEKKVGNETKGVCLDPRDRQNKHKIHVKSPTIPYHGR